MKTAYFVKTAISCAITGVMFFSSAMLYAEEIKICDSYNSVPTNMAIPDYDNSTSIDYIYADASENINTTAPSEENSSSDINWHKVFGWSTIGMAAVTLGSAAFMSESVHCPLAVVTTGFATATCVTGYYNYGGIISFSDGDWKYNTHAIMGTLATIGFIATIALASNDGNGAHVGTGAASGAAFAVTLGVLYF